MRYLRLPPKIKVLEAAAAIADGRVKTISDKLAEVTSSTGDKTYKVFVDIDSREVCSTDNGTVLRGYVGYPILSVLMLKGVLHYDRRVGEALKGIKWKELNERFKKYSIVEEHVKKVAEERGVNRHEVDSFKESVYNQVKKLRFKFINVCLE